MSDKAAQVEPNLELAQAQPSTSTKKTPTYIYIVIILLVVLICYLVFIQSNKPNSLSSKNEISTQPTLQDLPASELNPNVAETVTTPSIIEITQEQLIIDTSVFKSYADESGFECSGKECLTIDDQNESIYGFTTITGYYHLEEWESSFHGEYKCDAFVITNMSQKLREFAEFRISLGNSFYFMPHSKGQLITMLEMSVLNESQKALFNQSSSGQPITIGVVFKTFPIGSYPECTSPFDVVFIKK